MTTHPLVVQQGMTQREQAMTLTHVQAVADILADNKSDVEEIVYSRLVSQFAHLCREHNDQVDRDCFTHACYFNEPFA